MEPKVAIDTLWVLIAAALVFFMNAGFAFLEAGFCRAKNTVNILGKNIMVFCLALLAFWAVGYALMFGGLDAIFLDGSEPSPVGVPTLVFFLFQACFAATAASIVSGVLAERIQYRAYLVVAFLLCATVYPLVGRWVWGGGFLGSWGFHDFAGSTVVHSFGGWAALAGVLLLGPRLGKYKDGKPRAMPGHSMPLATLGTFILWLGWFGFNAGSALGIDASVPRIAVTTVLAASAGGVAATIFAAWKLGKPDLSMSLNGILAGLVAITASCAVVRLSAAVPIGLIAGTMVVIAVPLFDRFKIDDPVGALSVHLVAGVFGTLAVGVFAAPEFRAPTEAFGLLYGGGFALLGVQLAGVVVVGAFTFSSSLGIWWCVRRFLGLRVSLEDEAIGLDVAEMGMEAYPSAAYHGGALIEPEPEPTGLLQPVRKPATASK